MSINLATAVEELTDSVRDILYGDLDYKDDDQKWLQKWWAIRVEKVLIELDRLGEKVGRSWGADG